MATTVTALKIRERDDTAIAVNGNFAEVKSSLKKLLTKYKKVDFSAAQMQEVRAAKSDVRSIRTSLDATAKEVKRKYFNEPKKEFEARMAELMSMVGEVESRVDEILDAEEQERCDALTKVIELYKEDFQKTYALPTEYLSMIEYRKQYYNKTAKEADIRADIEAQFQALKAEFETRKAEEQAIRKALSGQPLINADEQVAKLDLGIPLVNILSYIESEIERLSAVDNADEQADTEDEVDDEEDPEYGFVDTEFEDEDGTPPIADAAEGIDLKSDFIRENGEALTKTVRVDITYPVDARDGMAELFRRLKETYGIVIAPVRE